MRARAHLALACATAAFTAAGASPAAADVFGPSVMASNGAVSLAPGEGVPEQAQYAHDPAISANGRYVAFDGSIGGLSGVWRRDLQSGEVRPVAVGRQIPGSEICEAAVATCNALLPSISQDGTYVSFTTTAPLAPAEDQNAAPDVYVRNMNISVSVHDMEAASPQPCEAEGPTAVEPSRCAFTLASALDGAAAGLAYEEGQSRLGSIASGRSAMSADGQQVAFVTTSTSNLAGANTPPLQVAVRNLQTHSTQLVSVERDPITGAPQPGRPVSGLEGGTSYYAVYAIGVPQFPIDFTNPYTLPAPVGASISGDGSAVAWMGRVIYKQAAMLPGENTPRYSEPLWRRIADGPRAPTQRVTGGSQPENPACAASGESELPGAGGQKLSDPCQGPFAVEKDGGVFAAAAPNAVPQLSADGYTVAFLATAQLVERGANFGLGGDSQADDLYLVDMRQRTPTKTVRALTELGGGVKSHAGTAPIVDVSVSPDGRQIAFSTERIQFPLGVPAFVSQPDAVSGMAELFDIDLENETLTRVTASFTGGPGEHPHEEVIAGHEPYAGNPADGAQAPSFSADGNLLAFSSTAANLVYGDGNTPAKPPGLGSADGGDVFTVTRKLFPPIPVEGYISQAPPNPEIAPEWRLGVTARSLANGKVVLYVTVPATGALSAVADGAVPVAAPRGARARRGHRATRVAKRRVAAAATTVRSRDVVQELLLSPSAAYRSLLTRSTGLSATARVSFNTGGRRLTKSVSIRFVRRAPAHRPKPVRSKAGHHR